LRISADKRACPPTGRTPKRPRDLIPLPPAPVPTVVAIGTQRAQVARVIRTTFTSFNDVIDDQPTADAAVRRAAVARRAMILISHENRGSQAFPRLSTIEGNMRRWPLVRSGRPTWWLEYWWSRWHRVIP
jgi:hypothetical protein